MNIRDALIVAAEWAWRTGGQPTRVNIHPSNLRRTWDGTYVFVLGEWLRVPWLGDLGDVMIARRVDDGGWP